MKNKLIGTLGAVTFAAILSAGIVVSSSIYFLIKNSINSEMLLSIKTSIVAVVIKTAIVLTILIEIAIIVCSNKIFKNINIFTEKISRVAEGEISLRIPEEGFIEAIAVNVNKLINNTKKGALRNW